MTHYCDEDNLQIKDPDEALDYTWDWAEAVSETNPGGPWLTGGETIVDHEITFTDHNGEPTPTALTLDSSAISVDGTYVTAWISGGTAGSIVDAVCQITTDNIPPRIAQRRKRFVIQHR